MWVSPFIKTLILLDESFTLMASFNRNYFPTPDAMGLRVRPLTYEFEDGGTIQSRACGKDPQGE